MNELKDVDPSPHPRLSALILNNNQLTKIPALDNNLELNTLGTYTMSIYLLSTN
jgi:hypothetical protein